MWTIQWENWSNARLGAKTKIYQRLHCPVFGSFLPSHSVAHPDPGVNFCSREVQSLLRTILKFILTCRKTCRTTLKYLKSQALQQSCFFRSLLAFASLSFSVAFHFSTVESVAGGSWLLSFAAAIAIFGIALGTPFGSSLPVGLPVGLPIINLFPLFTWQNLPHTKVRHETWRKLTASHQCKCHRLCFCLSHLSRWDLAGSHNSLWVKTPHRADLKGFGSWCDFHPWGASDIFWPLQQWRYKSPSNLEISGLLVSLTIGTWLTWAWGPNFITANWSCLMPMFHPKIIMPFKALGKYCSRIKQENARKSLDVPLTIYRQWTRLRLECDTVTVFVPGGVLRSPLPRWIGGFK